MGGRGASSGVSVLGKVYGSEYSTLLRRGNIKFLKYNDSNNAKTPMETMTKGRVYVTVDKENELSSITYYDKNGKRNKQIDLKHEHKGMKPHVHHGYLHNENDGKKGASNLTPLEKKMVARVNKIWDNRRKKR